MTLLCERCKLIHGNCRIRADADVEMVDLENPFVVLEKTGTNLGHLNWVALTGFVNFAETDVFIERLLQSLGVVLNKVPKNGSIFHKDCLVLIFIPCNMHRVEVFNSSLYDYSVQEDIRVFKTDDFVLG